MASKLRTSQRGRGYRAKHCQMEQEGDLAHLCLRFRGGKKGLKRAQWFGIILFFPATKGGTSAQKIHCQHQEEKLGKSKAFHVGFALVLPRGAAKFFPHHPKLVGKRFGLQRFEFLLGQFERLQPFGIFHQLCGGGSLLLFGLVLYGQMGQKMDFVCFHDDRGHILHLLYVCTCG